MDTVCSVVDLRTRVSEWRRAGESVALVPTMGALHDGHLSLVARARAEAQRTVASIFVNPTQFGPTEDLSAYPRDGARDAGMLSVAGCDLLFAPSAEEMYPPGFATLVRVSGLADCLCGEARPGHFDGVAQVVTKLLNQAGADVAVFGEKDWQQLAIIRRLAQDLDIPTRILGAPIVREADGLALSSRNRYLDPAERRVAGRLNAVLRATADRIATGGDPRAETAAARAALSDAGFDAVDYVECRTAEGLAPVQRVEPSSPARVFAAARIGRARLIDNMPVGDPA